MRITPITLKEACRFVDEHHRHHPAPQGGLFAIGLSEGEQVIGVAIVGRPVSRNRQDGYTAEVTRVCVLENYHNACSMLYSACWRAARAMGYQRLGTYILETEDGASVKASGFHYLYTTQESSWDRPGRPRVDTAPTCQKKLFEVTNCAQGY